MNTFRAAGALGLAALIVACSSTSGPAKTAPTAQAPTQAPNVHSGYLTKEARPDSARLVPPPPAPGSELMARDEAAA